MHGVGDAGTRLLFTFRSGTHGLNEDLGRHRGREGKSEREGGREGGREKGRGGEGKGKRGRSISVILEASLWRSFGSF